MQAQRQFFGKAISLVANPLASLAETLSMSGENAVNFFRSIHVERLFLAANGICPGTGLTYTDFIDIGV